MRKEHGDVAARKLETLSESIDRIVLFVDDLDRCHPEERVVEVLQAVHLLLAFPLFAVVVGVDQRCLKQSLQLHLKGLMAPERKVADGDEHPVTNNGDDGSQQVTPLDYLEKIFHVPYHLPPMSQKGFETMVQQLTERSKPVDPAKDDGKKPINPSAQPPSSNVQPARMQNAVVEPVGAPAANPSTAASPPAPDRPNLPPSPGSIEPAPLMGSAPLDDWEQKALQVYHPLVRSPRAVKRLLNTYRLVRAGIPELDWAAFRGNGTDRGEFHLVMLLLASAAGHPALAREWFRALREAKDLSPESLKPPKPDAAWLQFLKVYRETSVAQTLDLDPNLLSKWLDRVEVFVF